MSPSHGTGRIFGGRNISKYWRSRSSLGDYRKAVEALTEALIIVDKIGEVSIKGRILGNLANAYLAQGNYEDALARFEALHIQRYLGDQRGKQQPSVTSQ